MTLSELNASDLYHACDLEQFSFETTEELESLTEIIGQRRAVEAVQFGIDINQEGYNVFVLGPSGAGKRTLVQQFLEQRAPKEPTPDDWCYVNNFDQPHKPIALRLPTGKGPQLRDDMEQLMEDVQSALSGAFESDEYRQRRQSLQERFTEQQQQAVEALQQKARERGLAFMQTPAGLAFAPLDPHGKPMSPEEVQKLSEERRQEFQAAAQEMEKEAQRIMEETPRAQRRARRELKELNHQVAEQAVKPLIDELHSHYEDHPRVLSYLEAVKGDLVDQAEELLKLQREEHEQKQPTGPAGAPIPKSVMEAALLRRYKVNVLVEHEPSEGAPVISEDHPTHQNVIGRIEHLAQMGTLIADFNLIMSGALHRANGGYLILDTYKLLSQPFVWEALKRALQSREIRIESPQEMVGLISTITLEPEPIPLDVKVVLLGPPLFFHLLNSLDPEFAELFKVPADFEIDMDRGEENTQLYTRLLGTLAQKYQLRPFHRAAVARVIEHSSRLAGDAQKLSIHMRSVADLMREADYWARQNGHEAVKVKDVQQTIDAQRYRASRQYERAQELIQRELILIDTEGATVGQINGLAVTPFGDLLFGQPHRITARVHMGKGEVIDIEREVALGGPLHSKGVLILAGFLAGRYARTQPLSLSASLVFEQSYGEVEGDSASAAELCVLLSAIAEVPLKQSLAITGSVNQHGQVQAIGGVNEKIEGFFDLCQGHHLNGEQGVLIPAANVQHLMLRQEVIDAVEAGKLHIYPLKTIDQAMEMLTGLPAGEPDEQGNYPAESLNGKISANLAELSRRRQQFLPGLGDREGD
ncbi:Lon protease family protein [Nitrosococcus wardiae]|uniref:endopeptidase La n=1 Tax=Nitrosococcus wardiae TaxID=1814290 RepID=A0A4P7C402_9GAMM|nr:ATP-binding protein [Nitrosococcus wardiae]QBQ56559.1 ATP-binding protein [Nitrosococcus wardiae]